jgi:hypothetical protein
MSRHRTAIGLTLLVSCATLAMLAAPGLAEAPDPAVASAPANLAPVAGDDAATVTSGQSVVIPVMDNDSDPDGSYGFLFVQEIVSVPISGTAEVVGQSISYTANDGFVGGDSFTYRISDGDRTADATVTITVTADPNAAPVAVDDRARTRWGSPVVVDVLANDVDPDLDTLQLRSVQSPDHGRAEMLRGQIVFTPTNKYVGAVDVPYWVVDGRGGSSTGLLIVSVAPRFGVALKGTSRPVALRPLTVRGKVSTRIDGPVTVALQKRNDSGRWLSVQERRVRGSDRFTLTWTPTRPGASVVRLRAVWADGHRSTSANERLRIQARFDPEVSRVRAADLPHTWRPGCPVAPSGLRKIRMNYWDYQGRLQRGTLIGAAYVTSDYLSVFRRAFNSRFAIKKMYPADRYGGVDERAMHAGNTSAFNCRHVTGNPYRMSQHSYGNAIDINTFENPYVTGSQVYPAKAAVPYYYRREHNLNDPGVITARSSIAKELWSQGWAWGARWSNPDYQHWSSNGG